MTKKLVPLALAALSAHTTSAYSRTDFDDDIGLAKLTTNDGISGEGGGDPVQQGNSVSGEGTGTGEEAKKDSVDTGVGKVIGDPASGATGLAAKEPGTEDANT